VTDHPTGDRYPRVGDLPEPGSYTALAPNEFAPPPRTALEIATERRLTLLDKIRAWRLNGCPDDPHEFAFEIKGLIDDNSGQFYELTAIDRETGFEIEYGCFKSRECIVMAMQGLSAEYTLESADG